MQDSQTLVIYKKSEPKFLFLDSVTSNHLHMVLIAVDKGPNEPHTTIESFRSSCNTDVKSMYFGTDGFSSSCHLDHE